MRTGSQIFRDHILSADEWRPRMGGLQDAAAFGTFICAPSICSLLSWSEALWDGKEAFGGWGSSARVLASPNAHRLIETEFTRSNSVVGIAGFPALVSENVSLWEQIESAQYIHYPPPPLFFPATESLHYKGDPRKLDSGFHKHRTNH